MQPLPKSRSESTPIEAWRFQNRDVSPQVEFLAEESPLDIRWNGESLAITLCSPHHQRDLAMGLLFSEGRIEASDPGLIWSHGESPGHELTGPITWHEARAASISSLSSSPASSPASALNASPGARVLAMNSACGLCGKTEWESAPQPPLAPTGRINPFPLKIEDLPERFAAMREGQGDFIRTGGCHAAAAFSAQGRLLSLREDVGRHNAVDKVVGDLLSRGLIGRAADQADPDWPALLCVSGRIAYEIVAKAYRAGFSALAAVGAPSDLSVRHARAWGLTLLGFCREGRATLYSHGESIVNGMAVK
jgi:FdhD protein